ncbi:MAG: hypothetical protein IPN69_10625 [Acidobacteria bacterium]|nr:hypothetical protein [Acidobacteriota bacterium]MBK8149281.1 hypothetical protein [Acidobacteriota bacterium]MBK8811168.1 hypothetical protein [Acidobacteriota bacterium]
MTLDFSERERELLEEVLGRECNSLVDEVHHTDSFDYRQGLKEKLEILKHLRTKVEALASDN